MGRPYCSAHLVESPKYGSGTQRLAVPTKDFLRGFRAVDHNYWLISKLYLVHSAKSLAPFTILLGRINLDVWNVAHQGPVGRSGKTLDSSGVSHVFVPNNIQYGNAYYQQEQRASWVFQKLGREQW